MKFSVSLFLCIGLLFISCADKKKETSEEATVTIENSDKSKDDNSPERIKDCDDFLDKYENWANSLMDLMEKHKDDPIALVTSPEYTKTMAESTSFMQDWQTISVSCASNPYYEKRMDEIQDNIKKRNDALGLDN